MHTVLSVSLEVTRVTWAHELLTKASHMAMSIFEAERSFSPPCWKTDTWEHRWASVMPAMSSNNYCLNAPSWALEGSRKCKSSEVWNIYPLVLEGRYMWNNQWTRLYALYATHYNIWLNLYVYLENIYIFKIFPFYDFKSSNYWAQYVFWILGATSNL